MDESKQLEELRAMFRVEAGEHLVALETVLMEMERRPEDKELTNRAFRALHSLKGSGAIVGYEYLSGFAHKIEGFFDLVRKGKLAVDPLMVSRTLAARDILSEMLDCPAGVPYPVLAGRAAALVREFEGVPGSGPATESVPGGGDSGFGLFAPVTPEISETRLAKGPSKDAKDSLRIPARRLDVLIDLVGELVAVQARLSARARDLVDPEIASIAETMERLTSSLRDASMGLRMVPIGAAFSKMRRAVHDLSAQLGKTVRLETEGDDTELDKTVMERLGDPLVHIIRNAIDHGIEAPARRLEAGKETEGVVRLGAGQEGGMVVVEVSDDGAGLDLDRIRQIAADRGLIEKDSSMTDAEAMNLICAAGFSTAREVTDVSGRGVGMDVVKRTVEELGGTVEVESERGRGTTIRLKLPLTLAIIEGLMVRVRDQKYVIPLSSVQELVEAEKGAKAPTSGFGKMTLRDSVLPVLDLNQRFRLEGVPDKAPQVVVVEARGRKVGFVVDAVLGQQQTVIKRLGLSARRTEGVTGATILGDGSVALILDVGRMIGPALSQAARREGTA